MPEVWASLVDRGLLDYETQKKFIEETHYQPAMKALSPEVRAAIEKNPALVKVAFTTSVGHGAKGAARIIEAAWKKSGGGDALLDALINERKTHYGSSDEQTRQAVFNRLEGERRTAGLVSRADVAPLENKIAVAENKLKINSAYQFLYPMNHEEALKYIADPNGQKALGLDAQQAKSVSEMLHTQWTHMNAVEKKEREKYETDVMTTATNMAIGAKDQPADPVRALQIINESDLDGKTKLELRKALQNGTIDQDDPAFVADLKSRIAGGGQPVTEVELARGVAAAKLSIATKDKLVKLQESVAGPQGEIIKSAFRALDEAFKKSMMADGTPAQALAHYAAQNELQLAVAEGIERGNVLDLLNPQSKNYILPGIMQRHQLSTSERIQAMKDKLVGAGQSQAPQRKAGESIAEYQRRISGEAQ
jgi:hypothetical protein